MRSEFLVLGRTAPVLNRLVEIVNIGGLRPIIGHEFALQHVALAHALSESVHSVCKICLYVGQTMSCAARGRRNLPRGARAVHGPKRPIDYARVSWTMIATSLRAEIP